MSTTQHWNVTQSTFKVTPFCWTTCYHNILCVWCCEPSCKCHAIIAPEMYDKSYRDGAKVTGSSIRPRWGHCSDMQYVKHYAYTLNSDQGKMEGQAINVTLNAHERSIQFKIWSYRMTISFSLSSILHHHFDLLLPLVFLLLNTSTELRYFWEKQYIFNTLQLIYIIGVYCSKYRLYIFFLFNQKCLR